MPMYEYAPADFNQSECCYLEMFQFPHEQPLTHCPTCSSPIQRIFSTFSSGSKKAKKPPVSIKPKENLSSAGKAAQLSMQHFCGMGCRH